MSSFLLFLRRPNHVMAQPPKKQQKRETVNQLPPEPLEGTPAILSGSRLVFCGTGLFVCEMLALFSGLLDIFG